MPQYRGMPGPRRGSGWVGEWGGGCEGMGEWGGEGMGDTALECK
jgi:hypothetical protein